MVVAAAKTQERFIACKFLVMTTPLQIIWFAYKPCMMLALPFWAWQRISFRLAVLIALNQTHLALRARLIIAPIGQQN